MAAINTARTALPAAPATNAAAPAAAAGTVSTLAQAFGRELPVPITTNVATGQATLSTALADMGNILGTRQVRLSDIAVAISADATKSGSFNPIALQRLSIESQTNEQLSQLQKKIFDNMNGAITAWIRN